MLAVKGVDDSCDKLVSECDDELMLAVESKWDKEETCEHTPVCVVVHTSSSVLERFSGSFMDAVSVDEDWLLEDSLSVVDTSHWPPPNPAIRPSPPLSSVCQPYSCWRVVRCWIRIVTCLGCTRVRSQVRCRIRMTRL